MIIFLMFLISYFITDTAIGIFYVFSTMIIYLIIGSIIHRSDIEWLKYLASIIGIPFVMFLLIKSTENMLISVTHLMFLILVVNLIMSYSYKQKGTSKENISLVIGVVVGLGLIFYYYYNLSDYGDRIIVKQEIVAQEYLEEELGMDGFEAYVRNMGISLRGEEKIVMAYDYTGAAIEMIYKDNEIIDWTQKVDSDEYYENAEGSSYTLDVTPQSAAEEIVVNYFLYTIARDYDGLSKVLADIEPHRSIIENERENYEEGIFIKSYTIHDISTLPERGYSDENHILFYYGWEEIVDRYELIEYEIVRVKFTQLHSEKSNKLIPQWGDGTYHRSFIVGKSSDDENYRIYDFGMME